jgi:hypothetical protein
VKPSRARLICFKTRTKKCSFYKYIRHAKKIRYKLTEYEQVWFDKNGIFLLIFNMLHYPSFGPILESSHMAVGLSWVIEVIMLCLKGISICDILYFIFQ